MSLQRQFSQDVKRWLTKNTETCTWEINWKPRKAKRENVDLAGCSGKGTILIEIELRKRNPASNAAKVWKWRHHNQIPKGAILIQAFSGYYNDHREQRDTSKFVGSRMWGVRYIPIEFPFKSNPKSRKGGGARRKAAQAVAKEILKKLRKLNKIS